MMKSSKNDEASSRNTWFSSGPLECLDVEVSVGRSWTFFWPGRVVVQPLTDGIAWSPNGERQCVPLGTVLVAPPHSGQLRIVAPDGAAFRVIFEAAATTAGSPVGRVYFPQLWALPEDTMEVNAIFEGAVAYLADAAPVSLRIPTIVTRARESLETDLSGELDLEALAALAGVDRCHLCRTFQKVMGVPPHRFRAQLRIARARKLLADGAGCTEVAHAVGFFDQSHLTRSFKELTGTTPGAFARACGPVRVGRRPSPALSSAA